MVMIFCLDDFKFTHHPISKAGDDSRNGPSPLEAKQSEKKIRPFPSSRPMDASKNSRSAGGKADGFRLSGRRYPGVSGRVGPQVNMSLSAALTGGEKVQFSERVKQMKWTDQAANSHRDGMKGHRWRDCLFIDPMRLEIRSHTGNHSIGGRSAAWGRPFHLIGPQRPKTRIWVICAAIWRNLSSRTTRQIFTL